MKVAVIHPYRENVHRMYASYFFMPERVVQMATYLDAEGYDVDAVDFSQTTLDDEHHYTVPAPKSLDHKQMHHYGWSEDEIDEWFEENGDEYTHFVVDSLTPYFRDGVKYVSDKIDQLDKPMVMFGEWCQLVPSDFQDTPAIRDNWEVGVERWLNWYDEERPDEPTPEVAQRGVTSFNFKDFPMDILPAPDWQKFVDMDDYPESHCADVRFSRGCVEKCNFCHVAGMYDGKFNFKTAEVIKQDIVDLAGRQGFDKIKIRDDNFCAATETAKEVFEFIAEEYPDVEIMQPEGMEMRTASRDKELIDAIGECNYHSVRVGFETATDGEFSKNSLEWWEQAYEWFQDAGFGPGEIVTFVIRGHPHLDRTDEIHTAVYLSQFDVSLVSGGYRLVPGTTLWDEYVEEHGTEPPYEYGFGLPTDEEHVDDVGRLYRTVSRWNEWNLNLFDDDALDQFRELSWVDSVEDNGDSLYVEGTVSGWRRTEGIRYGFAYLLARRGYFNHSLTTETKREQEVQGHKAPDEFMEMVMDVLEERGIETQSLGGLL